MLDQQKMALYWRLPVFLQEAALGAYARYLDRLYYGAGYEEWRETFQSWRRRPGAETRAWQDERLRALVRRAATEVDFYRQSFSGVDWRAVKSAADLPRLPRLDKQSLRRHETRFIADGLDARKLWLEKTSGTTGTSLRIYWPPAMLPQWWALVEVAIRNVAGVAQNLPRAMMGGRPVVRGDARRPPYWRFNRRWRQLYLSAYHVSDTSAPGYAEAIRRYGSRWITGYGSAIAALAESAMGGGVAPVALCAAIVSGDTLLPGMRADIEKFFSCKCFDSYGQAEGVCMAMECARGKMHVIPEAGLWEILRDDGAPCAPGEVGEIVATGLLNDAMPLIRYRLGDYAAWSKAQDCSCGNPSPIIDRLEGRVDDYLIASDGRKIGRLSTAMKRSPAIHSAQIVQDRPGRAYLLVRPGDGYRSRDAEAVRADIIERIGAFALEIVEVPAIPRTPQGKTSLVVRLFDRPGAEARYEKILPSQRRSHGVEAPSLPHAS